MNCIGRLRIVVFGGSKLFSVATTSLLLWALFFVGCTAGNGEVDSLPYRASTIQVETEENKVPGTVTDFWEEPMYDDVEVPASLDPEGVYFRPAHEEIVEIPQGRHQQVRYPDGEARDNVFRNNKDRSRR